jgi:hydrogenase expression/formation protein HypD
MAEVFELRESFEWRGLGLLPWSALRLREAWSAFDAERRFEVVTTPAADNPACECGAILRGHKTPAECRLFGTVCSPETPMGSCMVSPEGACAAHWTYGRFRA